MPSNSRQDGAADGTKIAVVMAVDSKPPPKLPPAEADRRHRLAQALRENLKRRKSQSRGRREEADPASCTQAEPKRD